MLGFAKDEDSASVYLPAHSVSVPFFFQRSERERDFSRFSSSFVLGFRTTFSIFGKRSMVQQARFTVNRTSRRRNQAEWYMSNMLSRSRRANAQSS